MVVGIDVMLGFHRWSLNYVLPGGLILMDVALIFLRLINRRNWQSYMAQQLLVIGLGVLPAIFILLGLITDPLVSVVAICESIVLFVITLIMGGRAARAELRRRFHIK
ncbi:MAG: zinc ribbon domain-containing protein, partial [Lachnospiraceae bacterium]|nr:zinc ribbon domain-containing protein [Lachnospiraceae bacterium]